MFFWIGDFSGVQVKCSNLSAIDCCYIILSIRIRFLCGTNWPSWIPLYTFTAVGLTFITWTKIDPSDNTRPNERATQRCFGKTVAGSISPSEICSVEPQDPFCKVAMTKRTERPGIFMSSKACTEMLCASSLETDTSLLRILIVLFPRWSVLFLKSITALLTFKKSAPSMHSKVRSRTTIESMNCPKVA